MAGDRKVGVAVDFSQSSKRALQWAIDNMVGAGDALFIIHVQPRPGPESKHQLWVDTGSPLIPLLEFKQAEILKLYNLPEDPEVLNMLDNAALHKQAKIMAKIYWGDAKQKLVDAVKDLTLDSLVVGSRGLGPLKRILLGSVTDYVLSAVPCAVTVVKDHS